jgi:hypothetical protein
MKKLAALVGAGGMLLLMAVPVLGFGYGTWVVNLGGARQDTQSTAVSNSGDNMTKSMFNGGSVSQTTRTGNSASLAVSEAIANQYRTRAWSSGLTVVVNGGLAGQETGSTAVSNTGRNWTKSMFAGGNVTQNSGTGHAVSESYSGAWANIFTTKAGSFSFIH